MYAVAVEPLKSVYFLAEPPGQGPWTVEEGVDLDLSSNYDIWPQGSDQPEQVVAVSATDPKHFKVFKYARNIEATGFQSTGRTFGGFFSRQAWERFKQQLPSLIEFRSIPDDPESDDFGPPGSQAEG